VIIEIGNEEILIRHGFKVGKSSKLVVELEVRGATLLLAMCGDLVVEGFFVCL